MGSGGYRSYVQPDNLPVIVPGSGAQPEEEFSKDGDAFSTKEADNNGKADGDNPSSYTETPAFADGKDLRNRG